MRKEAEPQQFKHGFYLKLKKIQDRWHKTKGINAGANEVKNKPLNNCPIIVCKTISSKSCSYN